VKEKKGGSVDLPIEENTHKAHIQQMNRFIRLLMNVAVDDRGEIEERERLC
jgi:hypothetical protein